MISLFTPSLFNLPISFLSISNPSLSKPFRNYDRTTGREEYDRKWQEYERQRTLGKYMIDVLEHSALFRFVSKQFCLFRLFRYRFETPKQTEKHFFGFTKQTETNAKQILFRFVSVRTENVSFSFRGHPRVDSLACRGGDGEGGL